MNKSVKNLRFAAITLTLVSATHSADHFDPNTREVGPAAAAHLARELRPTWPSLATDSHKNDATTGIGGVKFHLTRGDRSGVLTPRSKDLLTFTSHLFYEKQPDNQPIARQDIYPDTRRVRLSGTEIARLWVKSQHIASPDVPLSSFVGWELPGDIVEESQKASLHDQILLSLGLQDKALPVMGDTLALSIPVSETESTALTASDALKQLEEISNYILSPNTGLFAIPPAAAVYPSRIKEILQDMYDRKKVGTQAWKVLDDPIWGVEFGLTILETMLEINDPEATYSLSIQMSDLCELEYTSRGETKYKIIELKNDTIQR